MGAQVLSAARLVTAVGTVVLAMPRTTVVRSVSTARDPITPLTVYVPVTFIVLGLTLGKRGAGLNYFFEPTLALLAYLVERAGRRAGSAPRPSATPVRPDRAAPARA